MKFMPNAAKAEKNCVSENAPTHTTPSVSGFSLAVAANVLWGTSFLASKYTLLFWGPLTASALRFAVALITMIIFFPKFGFKIEFPKSKSDWSHVFAVGVTGFGALYPLQLSGMKYVSSALSAAIMLTSPLLLVLLGPIFLGERLSSRKLLALGLGIAGGIFLISNGGSLSRLVNESRDILLGGGLTLAASLSLALSVVLTRKASKKISAPTLTFWSMLIGLILIAPFSVFETHVPQVATQGQSSFYLAIFSLLYLAVICSALCFLIWNRAISRATPKELASTMHLKTPVAILLGTVVAGEAFRISQIFGALIVAAGVYLSQTERKDKARV